MTSVVRIVELVHISYAEGVYYVRAFIIHP